MQRLMQRMMITVPMVSRYEYIPRGKKSWINWHIQIYTKTTSYDSLKERTRSNEVCNQPRRSLRNSLEMKISMTVILDRLPNSSDFGAFVFPTDFLHVRFSMPVTSLLFGIDCHKKICTPLRSNRELIKSSLSFDHACSGVQRSENNSNPGCWRERLLKRLSN